MLMRTRTVSLALGLVLVFAQDAIVVSQQARRLFAPEELGLLEGPDRDEWQKPEEVMDRLEIGEGARVADIGAGGGWFTIRLARRVTRSGVVYAEDIQQAMIDSIYRRVGREGLSNVRTILGTPGDPRLPPGLDAVLMVDTYPQIPDPVAVLRHIAAALAPNGKLGVVDFKPDGSGGPGPALEERVSADVVKRHAAAAGLALRSHETFLRYQYLLIFVRAEGEVKAGGLPPYFCLLPSAFCLVPSSVHATGSTFAAMAAFTMSIAMNGTKPVAIADVSVWPGRSESHDTPPAKITARPISMLANDVK